MKTYLATALLALLPLRATADPIDPDRMIAVLIQLEGGKWGRLGGAANISYSAWSDHSRLAYQLSASEAHALPIYRLHVLWLIHLLPLYGAPVTVHNVALAWRWGLTGGQRRRWVGEYGTRAANLFAVTTAPETVMQRP